VLQVFTEVKNVMEPFSYYRYLQRYKGCDIATSSSSYHKVRPHRRSLRLTIQVVFSLLRRRPASQ